MNKNFYKRPLFIICSVILLIIILSSLLLPFIYTPGKPPGKFIYDKHAVIVSSNPHKPTKHHIMGTDAKGEDVFYRVVEGAKITLLFAILIGLSRLILSLLIGILLSTLLSPFKKWFYPFVDAFVYAPAALIIYTIAAPIVVAFGWAFGPQIKFYFLLFTLTLVAVPSLSLFISTEIDYLKKKEFIQSAVLLGGGQFHRLRIHYWPHLKFKLIILFTQHFIQIMLLFAHLGLMGLFIGGTHVETVSSQVQIGNGAPTETADNGSVLLGNDWGGLVAEAREDYDLYPWLILGPVSAFTFTILAVTGILESIKKPHRSTIRFKKKVEDAPESFSADLEDFEAVQKTNTPM